MSERYRLSFTTGGLFLRESEEAVKRFSHCKDWKTVRDGLHQDNFFQVRTEATAVRLSREVIARLQGLSESEIDYLSDCTQSDKAHLIWIAICRRYAFIREFACEVLHERFVGMRQQMYTRDFDAFFSSKALWHPELDRLAKSTQPKLRQCLFRMMREAGFIDEKFLIQPTHISPSLVGLLSLKGMDEFYFFPVSDNQIQRWLQ